MNPDLSIALWEHNQPMVAVVHAPALGETFTAVSGEGAWLNGSPIRVSGIAEPNNALLGTGFPYRNLDLLEDYMLLFRRFMSETQGVRRPVSASLDLCYVAAGGLIVREAGGIVTDWTAGENWLHGNRILAGNPAIHDYLCKCVIEDVHPDRLEA